MFNEHSFCVTLSNCVFYLSPAGAKVFIDSKAQMTLLGTVMDYVDERLTSEFVFENPNVTGFCGCGESFSLDKSIFEVNKTTKKESSGEAT